LEVNKKENTYVNNKNLKQRDKSKQ
jgi:hypothetical protein